MGTDKRERQKANRSARLAAEQAAEQRARRNQTIRNVVVTGVVLVAVFVLVAQLTGCSSSAGSDAASDPVTDVTTLSTTYGKAPCPPAKKPATPKIDFDDAPRKCIDPSKSYTATVVTSEGTVVMDLDTNKTPLTANNFIVLARWGFFDGTDLFRTEAPSGIIQGGSPHTQDNSDPGPGYTIPDEGVPYTSADYPPGTIAMANSGQPHTASAQFFWLANEGGRYLGDQAQTGPSAGSYVPFGKVTKGLDVLVKISALDSGDGQGTPTKKVTIERVTISES